MSRRGYIPEDEKQFKGRQLEALVKAADEVQFLLDQGYDVKPTTTFVGNHYMFSERQRLALARSVSSREWIRRRIDKTQTAVELLLERLESLNIPKACFYLDAPVSNSGRLSSLIRQCAQKYDLLVEVEIITDVDRVLEKLPGVISGDAIILNRCLSWLNILPEIVEQLESVWKIQL